MDAPEEVVLSPDAVSPPAALCPVHMTWIDDIARMTLKPDRLVAINPVTGRPADMVARSLTGWGDVITASDWLEESQRLAERCLSGLSPLKFACRGKSGRGGPVAEWVPCVVGRDIADNGIIELDLMLTCLNEGDHFGETMTAVLRVGWDINRCQSVTGLYALAQTAASIYAEASDPDWAKAMFVRRSALRVARNAEKHLPEPIMWADANAALNSRSRLLASRYGVKDIRAEALTQAERDGLLVRVKGKHGPGGKWLRTDKPLPDHVSGGRWRRVAANKKRSKPKTK